MGTVRFRQLVGGAIYSPDGAYMAAPSGDVVRLWDATTGKDIRTFAGHGGPVHSIAFDPTGKMLASGGVGDDTIRSRMVERSRFSDGCCPFATRMSPESLLIAVDH